MFDLKKVKSNLPEGFTITFHAGFMDEEDNSLHSMQRAVDMNAGVVEMDVTFRDDGTPVIIHADTAGENGGASFDDALDIVAKGRCLLNLDIKSVKNLPAVDELVKKHKLESRAFYTGVNEDWVEEVKNTSSLPYYLNFNVNPEDIDTEDKMEKLAEKIISLGAIGLNSRYNNVTPRLTEIMHSHGLLTSYWTPCTEESLRQVLLTFPDNITTRRPDLLYEILEVKI